MLEFALDLAKTYSQEKQQTKMERTYDTHSQMTNSNGRKLSHKESKLKVYKHDESQQKKMGAYIEPF